jgi:hypothetical protein
MTLKPEKADDDVDALEALESEEKEFNKVRLLIPLPPTSLRTIIDTFIVYTGCRN